MRHPIRAAVVASAATTFLLIIPAALGYRSGAPSLYSAGPASFGAGCVACHSLNLGGGGAEVVGAPARYRAGQLYQVGVRVFDPVQAGAGFEVSVEKAGGHAGALLILDSERTQYADNGFSSDFVTHTDDGVDDSVADWTSGGGAYQYNLEWQSPGFDMGTVTFFASGNAVNDDSSNAGDSYYFGYALSRYAVPGDADADTDLDLRDFAGLQNCFMASTTGTNVCAFVSMTYAPVLDDVDVAMFVETFGGPTAPYPGEFVLADAVRGGKLYDSWWQVNGAPEPLGDHPLYPPAGMQAGSVTFRCKECHGWDYKGADGAYGSGSHFTGIDGILATTQSAEEIFELLSADPSEVPNGHNMLAYGLTEADLWDLTKFVREGLIDTNTLIDETGTFLGDLFNGSFYYGLNCSHCHGEEGTALNFGTAQDPEYVGTVATENPWEFVHKVRYGHPGAPMPASELLGWLPAAAGDLGRFAQEILPD